MNTGAINLSIFATIFQQHNTTRWRLWFCVDLPEKPYTICCCYGYLQLKKTHKTPSTLWFMQRFLFCTIIECELKRMYTTCINLKDFIHTTFMGWFTLYSTIISYQLYILNLIVNSQFSIRPFWWIRIWKVSLQLNWKSKNKVWLREESTFINLGYQDVFRFVPQMIQDPPPHDGTDNFSFQHMALGDILGTWLSVKPPIIK